MAKVIVLGAGGFGISLAVTALRAGHEVKLWSAIPEELEAIRRDGEQKQKLPGVAVPREIMLCDDISSIDGSDIVIFGIPSLFVRKTAKLAAPYITYKMIVVNSGKGLEEGSLKRLSVVIGEEIPNAPVVALSGPSHAEELAIEVPTTITAACETRSAAEAVQDALSTSYFRIYINDDIVGCELGGALKNIIALCAGICDGLGYGDNTKAALMTRGMYEIAKLGIALGARCETFSGLTGLGDLIVTCCSMHSRNRRAGILIGQGTAPEEAVRQVGTVEGYHCCRIAHELSRSVGIEMPITDKLYGVLFEGRDIRAAVPELMSRPRCHEVEDYWV